MKISKKSQKKSPSKIALIALIAAILVGAGAYAYYVMQNDSSTDNNQNSKTNTTDSDVATDGQNGDNPEEKSDSTPTKGEDKFEEEPAETIKDATLTITALSQANGMVSVQATAQNVDKGGRCIVYFSSEAGTPVSKYMTIANTSNGVTCSVDVNELEFSYLGKWTARIVYTTPSDKKVEATGTLIIK